MEKLDLQTPNFTDENIQKLSELFPNCVTENSNGKTIDFDALKQELSSNVVEGNKERYQLTWPGKAESLVTANTPINKTLRPAREESKDFDNTENLYIEGDNLEVLKLLQETYLGKIKMIYIDPPYNTGNDFVYKDNFTQDKAGYDEESGNIDDEGGRLVANPDSNGRYHSNWLSMMYPRLKLARNLLKDDGVIFISIDDNEVHNLRKICDEIFGEKNFVSTVIWEKKYSPQNDAKWFSDNHDHILIFSKIKENWRPIQLPRTEEQNKRYANRDDDPRGNWKPGDLLRKDVQKTGLYTITTPSGRVCNPPSGRSWRVPEYRFKEMVSDNRIWFGENGGNIPAIKRFLTEVKDGIVPMTIWKYTDVGHNQDATKELKLLFENKSYLETPKPVKLLNRIAYLGSQSDDLILDFFSGSASTAHAVMKLNAQDGGNRKFIMAQIPEATDEKSEAYKADYKTIAEIGKERIRRAGEKIKTDNADKEGIDNLDTGFRVLKVDSSNMKDVYFSPDNTSQDDMFDMASNIKDDRSDEDLLFMVLLDWGIDLSVKIERREVLGKAVYFADDDYLAACFSDNIDENFVKAVVAEQPRKVVLRDSGFASSSVKINVEQIFKQADIEVKVI
jgi:adenine-specific DNA-methyltransferase